MPDPAPEIQYTPLYRFWHPRFWPLWLGLAFMRAAVLLPVSFQLATGRVLGRLMGRVLPKRRAIARVNIGLCFPDKDDTDLERIVDQHFENLGMGVFEMCIAWWASDARLERIVELHGIGHLRAAQDAGRGVLLVTGHFTGTEITCRLLVKHIPKSAAVYRPSRNPFIDELFRRIRGRSADALIPKTDIRRVIRLLRDGYIVWYASDQSYRRRNSAPVPFFGEPAMTSLALSQITAVGKASVIPYLPRRTADSGAYVGTLLKPLEDFPGDDPVRDAVRVNQLLEAHIREAPDQYYWVHRRFKNRPPPHPDPYADI